MASRGRWSRAAFRTLLRVYPASFRERYGKDLETDLADLLAERGAIVAWRRVAGDLFRSLRVSHRTAGEEKRHVERLTLGQTASGAFGSIGSDVRYAVRTLWRSPVFTTVTIATLALGIGANSAIFSLVNAVLFRPIGYADPDRLMLVYEGLPASSQSTSQRWSGVSPADWEDLSTYQTSFSNIGIYRLRAFELSGTGEPEQLNTAQVSDSVFPILGVNAAQGRALRPPEEDARVVVLSHAFWQRRFAGAEVIGQSITLGRLPYTIVGVMPAGFEFPKRGPQLNGEPADLWMPLVFSQLERQSRGNAYSHTAIGRLRDGISAEQAAADTAALAPRIRENYPPVLRDSPFSVSTGAVPLADEISRQVRRPLLVLLGAVALVLLIACANVANLILSRAVAREREVGLRTALGATRFRLLQLLLVESLLIAGVAGGLGLLISQWIVRAIPAVIATSLPGVSNVHVDGRVVAFTLALSALTAVGFSLVPLLVSGRPRLNDVLHDGGGSVGGVRRHRVQGSLVVVSVALAFVLLVSAGLLARSLMTLMNVETGVGVENVLTMRTSLPFSSYNTAIRVRPFYRNLIERLRALPGVRAASVSTDLPVLSDGERRVFTPDSPNLTSDILPTIAVTWVHGDYFAAFGIPLVAGRPFLAEEQVENRMAAIVSRRLAARYWPGEDAVGKRLRWGIPSAPQPGPWMTVVGVAGDVVDGPLQAEAIDHVYVPYTELPDEWLRTVFFSTMARTMMITVRSETDARRLTAPAREEIRALDSSLAVTNVATMTQLVTDVSAPQRFSASVLAGFAVCALLLAAIGLYGVLAFGVAQRTREIGVRLALGADSTAVIGLIMRRGMFLIALGIVLGVAGSLAAARALGSLLYETPAYDPATFGVVLGVLTIVSLVACYLPARRATRIDPLMALRTE